MRERVLARYRFAGADPAALALLDTCLSAALAARATALADADPRLLHPARTVLILLDDADVSDAVLLAAAALLDSQEPRWRGAALPDLPADAPGVPAALALCGSVPTPDTAGEERLLEELVVAPPAVQLLACAERLDLARHVHLLEPHEAARWVQQVEAVYAPAAWRAEPRLARRLERWAGARGHKLEGG